MKRLRVIAMAACREELLGQLQRLGCVEIREPETAGEDWSGLLERESSRLAEAKGALGGGEHRPGRHAAVRTGEGRAVRQAQARHREGVSGAVGLEAAGQNRHPRRGVGCGPFPGSRPRCPPSGSPGRAAALAGSGPAAGGGGNGARALPPGDLPRGNGRGRPAAGVGGAACGVAGDQRRQAAAIPAAPLPPGGGGAR